MSSHHSHRFAVGALTALVTVALMRGLDRSRRLRRDRGDVPGWVLITVMTAGLVSALWVFAGNALMDMFRSAIAGVTGK